MCGLLAIPNFEAFPSHSLQEKMMIIRQYKITHIVTAENRLNRN
jgi:hypothetical protein